MLHKTAPLFIKLNDEIAICSSKNSCNEDEWLFLSLNAFSSSSIPSHGVGRHFIDCNAEGNNKVDVNQALKDNILSFNAPDSKWEGYVEELPSELATEISLSILDIVESEGFIPEKVSALMEGGIMFEFVSEQFYLVIEVDNEGTIGYVKEQGEFTESNVISLEQLKEVVSSLSHIEA